MNKRLRKVIFVLLVFLALLWYERYSVWVDTEAQAEDMIEEYFPNAADSALSVTITPEETSISHGETSVEMAFTIECCDNGLTLRNPRLISGVVTYNPLFGKSWSGTCCDVTRLKHSSETIDMEPKESVSGTLNVKFVGGIDEDHSRAKVAAALTDDRNLFSEKYVVSNVVTLRIEK